MDTINVPLLEMILFFSPLKTNCLNPNCSTMAPDDCWLDRLLDKILDKICIYMYICICTVYTMLYPGWMFVCVSEGVFECVSEESRETNPLSPLSPLRIQAQFTIKFHL